MGRFSEQAQGFEKTEKQCSNYKKYKVLINNRQEISNHTPFLAQLFE